MQIALIRHGETAYNQEFRYLGRTDLPLSPEGRAKLGQAPFAANRVYTSPLVRTKETAAILFPGAELVPVEGLEEMDFGAFEGKNYKEMEHDPAYRAWVDGGCLGPCPGGEDKASFCRRVCGAFEGLLGAGGDPLVIVAHGGTLMAIMERYAQPPKGYFDWHCPPGCGFLLEDFQFIRSLDCRKEGQS